MFKSLKRSILVCAIPVLSSGFLVTSAYAICHLDYKNNSENTWNITLENYEDGTGHIYCPDKTLNRHESCTFSVNPGNSVLVGFSHSEGHIEASIEFASTINGNTVTWHPGTDINMFASGDHCPSIRSDDSSYGITLNSPSIGDVIFEPYGSNESTLNAFSKINFEADTNKKFS
ncbi:hypothetical protein [Piscirickettsia salmonis]|uniref:hypothetical protein n=1 Tax=Piscirickettsia salmonis TaxID=1238 RepID=UPI003EBD37E3